MTATHGFDSHNGAWRTRKESRLSARIRPAHRLRPAIPDDTPKLPQEQDERVATTSAFELGVRRLMEVYRDCARGVDGLTPLSEAARFSAKETLREVVPPSLELVPDVVPSHLGDVQLEWSLPTALMEIHITPSGERFVSIEARDGQVVFDGDYSSEALRHVHKELDRAHHGG
jgi:hypothetical protein